MTVTLMDNLLVVSRGLGPRIYNESRLMHLVKKELLAQGHDVIKKLMWKDGHMVDEHLHYIRERKGAWCAWHDGYAVRHNYEQYNRFELILKVERRPEKEFVQLLTERFQSCQPCIKKS